MEFGLGLGLYMRGIFGLSASNEFKLQYKSDTGTLHRYPLHCGVSFGGYLVSILEGKIW